MALRWSAPVFWILQWYGPDWQTSRVASFIVLWKWLAPIWALEILVASQSDFPKFTEFETNSTKLTTLWKNLLDAKCRFANKIIHSKNGNLKEMLMQILKSIIIEMKVIYRERVTGLLETWNRWDMIPIQMNNKYLGVRLMQPCWVWFKRNLTSIRSFGGRNMVWFMFFEQKDMRLKVLILTQPNLLDDLQSYT